MKPSESFIGQPIRSLQTMLRIIAEGDDAYHPVIPDGIYGPETTHAVSVFQRNHGLPVTGVTDHATWEAVVARHEPARIEAEEAEGIFIILNPGQVIRQGETSPHVYLVQAMLQALADIYQSLGTPSHNGILDAPTSDSLSNFQALSGLPMTGELDKHTWRQLVLQYPLGTNLPDLPINY